MTEALAVASAAGAVLGVVLGWFACRMRMHRRLALLSAQLEKTRVVFRRAIVRARRAEASRRRARKALAELESAHAAVSDTARLHAARIDALDRVALRQRRTLDRLLERERLVGEILSESLGAIDRAIEAREQSTRSLEALRTALPRESR